MLISLFVWYQAQEVDTPKIFLKYLAADFLEMGNNRPSEHKFVTLAKNRHSA